MADNFNMKQFLMENKLGAYSKLKENEEQLQEREVIYVIEDGQCYRKDDEGNKDLVNMSYCKRFAESAGSLKDMIREIQEGGVDVKELVKMVNDAQKSGKEIAVDGEPVIMWVASMGRLKTANSTYNIVYDIASGDSILSFDGEEVSLPPYTPKQQPARIDTRTPEEKKKAADAWNDRFGPGGGYDLPTGGRRTFDEGKEEVEEDIDVRPFNYSKELPTKKYTPNQVKMQDIVNFVKKHPGITTKELALKAYGNYGIGDKDKVMQGAVYMIDRAVHKRAIVKVKDIKVGQAVFTYFTPEDYREFLQKKKSMKIGKITMKEEETEESLGGINERISDEAIERFEGLANIQDLTVLKAKLRMLTEEWLTDGFEKEDIVEYFEYLVNEV